MVTLSIVIPAYNEAERLPLTLTAIAAYLGSTGLDAELIVVDDGSSDGTAEAARNATGVAMPPQVLRHDEHTHARRSFRSSAIRCATCAALPSISSAPAPRGGANMRRMR